MDSFPKWKLGPGFQGHLKIFSKALNVVRQESTLESYGCQGSLKVLKGLKISMEKNLTFTYFCKFHWRHKSVKTMMITINLAGICSFHATYLFAVLIFQVQYQVYIFVPYRNFSTCLHPTPETSNTIALFSAKI